MVVLTALWLPILLSSVIVFIVSSVIHMASPWHKSDYPRMPNEDQVMDALRPLAIPPGDYLFPRPATRADLASADFRAKMQKGPVVLMTVMPNGPMSMGRSLGGWFLNSVVIGIFAACITGQALPAGAQYPQVFRLIALTSFMGYAIALWQLSIWYRRSWRITIKATVDGVIYALLTAGTFGWLWPR